MSHVTTSGSAIIDRKPLRPPNAIGRQKRKPTTPCTMKAVLRETILSEGYLRARRVSGVSGARGACGASGEGCRARAIAECDGVL